MSIKELIGDLLNTEREEIDIEPAETTEVFRKRRKNDIEDARKKEEKLRQRSDEILEELESSLKEIKEFSDDEDLQVVEDVAQSFYNKRKNLVKDLSLSKDLEDHVEDFNNFVDDFNNVSRKEGVVMKRIEKQSGQLQSSIQEMIDHSDKLQEFLEESYSPVLQLQELKEKTSEIQETERKIKETEEKIEELENRGKEDELQKKEQRLEEIRESEEMETRDDLEERKEELEDRKQDMISSINQDISMIERGLRKAVYEIKNNETGFSGDIESIEGLMSHDFRENREAVDHLDEVQEVVKENSLLGDRQLEKFSEGVENLSNIDERLEEIDDLDSEIKEVEEELESLEVVKKEEKVSESIEQLEKEIDERQEKIEDLKDKQEKLEEELRNRISQLERFLNSELTADVSIQR